MGVYWKKWSEGIVNTENQLRKNKNTTGLLRTSYAIRNAALGCNEIIFLQNKHSENDK